MTIFQSIPVLNELGKSIAFFQKWKNAVDKKFLIIS